jgi:hypothetical protein
MTNSGRNPSAAPATTALRLVAGASLLVLLGACASTPPPAEELAVGRAAVERAGSSTGADAPVPLARSREKLAQANTAYAQKDYPLARRLAEQAEADAVLAEAQARSVRSSKALSEVREGIRQLREEMARS